MTFGARTFQGALQGVVTPPTFGGANISALSGIRSVTFGLATDGTYSAFGGTASGSNWFSPVQAGIGSSYWVKLTVTSTNSTTVTGSATGTVLALSGALSWTFANSGTSLEGFGAFTLTFYADAAGTQVVGTSTGNNWDVGRAS